MSVEYGHPKAARNKIVSPAELLKVFLDDGLDTSAEYAAAGAIVGGASDEEQDAGVVSLMDAGDQKLEQYAPLLWKRVQVRCLAPTLDQVDRIGNHVYDLLSDQKWLVLTDSTGTKWFVHGIYVNVGSSHHIDSSATWESLLFCVVCVGRDPVPTS